jgi:hypothetical protein
MIVARAATVRTVGPVAIAKGAIVARAATVRTVGRAAIVTIGAIAGPAAIVRTVIPVAIELAADQVSPAASGNDHVSPWRVVMLVAQDPEWLVSLAAIATQAATGAASQNKR